MIDDEEDWTDFDEQQARTDALSLAVTISKVGTKPQTILNRAQKFYEFIKKKKAKVHVLPDNRRKIDEKS